MPNGGPQSGFLRPRQHFPELEESDNGFMSDLIGRVRLIDILEALGVPGGEFGMMTL
jgi:hypothetical protein